MILLEIFSFAVFVGVCHGWANSWDGRLDFTCPAGQYISSIESIHDNGKEDRLWNFKCSGSYKMTDCANTGMINEYDNLVAYTCPGDKVLVGMGGVHDNEKEDRLFWFRCCNIAAPVRPVSDCHTTGFANSWDGRLNLNLGTSYIFKGVYSCHDNNTEDRRWKFYICKLSSVETKKLI